MGGRYSWRDLAFSLVEIVGVVGSYISGFDLFKKLFSTQTETIAAVIYIIIFSVIVVIAFLVREFQVMRKEKYANISEKLHDTMHNIRNLQTFMNSMYPEESTSKKEVRTYIAECKERLSKILDDTANIFQMLTSTRCRATIKTVFEHEADTLYLDTLARDNTSTNRWKDLDNKRVRENKDRLDANLIHRRLLTEETANWHYFCNDLTASGAGFEGTSLDAYHDHFRARAVAERRWFTKKHWVLPYKSIIICAIRQPQMDRLPDQVEAVGLLCIDSELRRVFVEQWDVQLCFAVADALYHPVSELMELMDLVDHFTDLKDDVGQTVQRADHSDRGA